MLNKPAGVVSATQDSAHKTVVDLLDYEFRHQLHIAGRLDLNSSGLVLLTNDSRWSSRLTAPDSKVTKRYRVSLEKPMTPEYVQAFAEGMYFPYEDITTKPVELRIIDDFSAELDLIEGRYHQIKRMFGRFRNPVKTLHRYAIGDLVLDETLLPGQSRLIDGSEIFATTKGIAKLGDPL
jgi:16S rRNA pseudouridine516 synthase